MESARPHPLPVVIVSFLVLAGGFLAGFTGAKLFYAKNLSRKDKPRAYGIYGNNIMMKRMLAINAAVKEGKEEYEFEVAGFYPVPGTKN